MSNELPILEGSLYKSEVEAIFQNHLKDKSICKISKDEISQERLSNLITSNGVLGDINSVIEDIYERQLIDFIDTYGYVAMAYWLIKEKIEELVVKNQSNKSDFVKCKLGWIPSHDDLILQILNKFNSEASAIDVINHLGTPVDDVQYFTLCRDADSYLSDMWEGSNKSIRYNPLFVEVALNWAKLYQHEQQHKLERNEFRMRYLKSVILIDDESSEIKPEHVKYLEINNKVMYLLHPNIIHTFWKQFNEKIWRHLEYATFLSCFDLKNPPTAKIIYEKGMQTLFVYFLSNIDDNIGAKVNDKIALVNFGIKNYRQLKKDQAKGSSAKRNDKRTIDKLFRLHSNDTSVNVL